MPTSSPTVPPIVWEMTDDTTARRLAYGLETPHGRYAADLEALPDLADPRGIPILAGMIEIPHDSGIADHTHRFRVNNLRLLIMRLVSLHNDAIARYEARNNGNNGNKG